MYECEVLVPWMVDGKKTTVWKVRSVTLLDTGTHRGVRCMHCQGEVRVHKQQVPEGPADHVEHTSRDDAEHCPGSPLFKGVFRVSQTPVK